MSEQSETARVVPVGWMRRPSGSNMFQPGARHLTTSDLSREALGSVVAQSGLGDLTGRDKVRTLCGSRIPRGGLRGDPQVNMFARIDVMDGSDLDQARPCTRCVARAEKMGVTLP